MITNRILSDLAFALADHESALSGSAHFVDLTTGDLTFIMDDYMFEEGEITEEEICSYKEWEQDAIRTFLNHDLVRIEPIPSHESFRIMEAFTELRSEKEQQRLYKALNGRHPFANFRYAAENLGIIQQWYDFKGEAEARMAEDWLNESGLEIKDGKIILKNATEQAVSR